MIIGLIGRIGGQSDSAHKNLKIKTINLIDKIKFRGHSIIIESDTAKNFSINSKDNIGDIEYIAKIADICIVMGGDGTMLNAAKLIKDSIPILGINLGNVGFITDVPFDFDFDLLIDMLEKKEYSIENRTMLKLSTESSESYATALNDVVVSRATGKIIEFDIQIDREHAYTARGDGLMVTTPTGSTAYALSGGGPIIHPNARVLEILPIMAQSMSTRPLIVNDMSEITFNLIKGDAEIFVDGNMFSVMYPGMTIKIIRSNVFVKFIHPYTKELKYSYYKTLSEKLNWHFLPGTQR